MVNEPITRIERYLQAILDNGGGGGGDITVKQLNVSSNNTYTAPSGKAYSPVVVDVPNTYAVGDEGKVVSNGALVSQTSDTATQNGTVDTTLINSLTVNVSGGGGVTNIKTGTFTAVEGAADNIVDTGYTGNGYPVAMLVVVDGGLENNTNASSQMWQASPVNIIGAYYMAKSNFNLAPIYDSTNNIPVEDRANIVTTRKSGSGTTSFNYKGVREIKFFTGSGTPTGGTGSSETAIKFYDKKTFKYAAGSASGFCVGAVYNWWIIYSS